MCVLKLMRVFVSVRTRVNFELKHRNGNLIALITPIKHPEEIKL